MHESSIASRRALDRRARVEYDIRVTGLGARSHGAKWSRRDEARALFRNAILDAAEEVFSERGFHSARIQQVAERARTAVGTIYNHFGQKEDVLRALFEERTGQLIDALQPAPDDPHEFEARLATRFERVLVCVSEHRAFFTLATELGMWGGATATARELLGKKHLAYIDRVKAALEEALREGVQLGAIDNTLPTLLTRFLGGVVRTLTQAALDETSPPPAEAARAGAAFFVRGARGASSPARSARRSR